MVEATSTDKSGGECKTGNLMMFDLAGSQQLKKSEAIGDDAKEANEVWRSLSALYDVIEALSANRKHILYRTSTTN